jgi:hypothetical protein
LLQLDPHTLCFSAAGLAPSKAATARKKVEQEHVTKALAGLSQHARYNQLREQVMDLTDRSRRTAQLASPRLAGKVPSCSPTASIDCRFDSHDFAPGRGCANPARGESGPEACDGSVVQTCSSVLPPPEPTSVSAGFVLRDVAIPETSLPTYVGAGVALLQMNDLGWYRVGSGRAAVRTFVGIQPWVVVKSPCPGFGPCRSGHLKQFRCLVTTDAVTAGRVWTV